MRCEVPLPLLGLLLCVAEFTVEISGTTVTITCPSSGSNIKVMPKNDGKTINDNKYMIENHNSSPLNVTCEENNEKHEMYLNAKVCTNCEELDTLTVTGIIIADLLITLGVLILVHYFSKNKKGQSRAAAGSRPRAQKMQRPPPVPNPDYEVRTTCAFSTFLCWLGRDRQSWGSVAFVLFFSFDVTSSPPPSSAGCGGKWWGGWRPFSLMTQGVRSRNAVSCRLLVAKASL
uniref:CD3e molecule n=1 Tax=Phasianus colchicus TaxID=9054 RepID=A0A669Q1J0_PHACC